MALDDPRRNRTVFAREDMEGLQIARLVRAEDGAAAVGRHDGEIASVASDAVQEAVVALHEWRRERLAVVAREGMEHLR